ncbi:Transglutaminase-like superfamily protein [Pseudoruegeria aquimaris]|uniref:Transglutaminase-like superfamily protein n=1 Tax=Pseudoruegeria aquimaris TaxID=393663 RepID=A0A1Y5SGF3_9RHOB|nr:transglutaminase family protein [Pseudoruegeria aquimaris]SLN40240.1 Transglutaminase-like superfamily protein [Pseudoruegeria aquimaris]
MRLTIDHTTRYLYEQPQRRITQSLRLTPAQLKSQKILSWDISSDGAQIGARFVDGAGDVVLLLTKGTNVESVEIRVQGVVDTTDTAGVLTGLKESIPPLAYLRDTPLTAPSEALRALAADVGAGGHDGALSLAHALAGATRDRVDYVIGATEAGVPAAQVLDLGQGVCQDHAHVLISIARLSGLPARYVTGYLHSDASGEAHEASHAWAELFVEGLGWVGFDPANRCCPDDRYVRIGSGLDALHAAPVRGMSFGAGSETMEYSLTVSLGQSQQ